MDGLQEAKKTGEHVLKKRRPVLRKFPLRKNSIEQTRKKRRRKIAMDIQTDELQACTYIHTDGRTAILYIHTNELQACTSSRTTRKLIHRRTNSKLAHIYTQTDELQACTYIHTDGRTPSLHIYTHRRTNSKLAHHLDHHTTTISCCHHKKKFHPHAVCFPFYQI